ncbi:hypothetical protein GCM10023216_30970 [Isoptericola chiayiensis]|uniref:Uncharacterized protein n=1 Tax=Isoptericola chiayiensis TaxID=579446 RepID=A0ABP8YR83_9MICO|nr:hypothetical protein [Isoptericola chiayiensis]NOW01673.1 hypothetical protein [Isoptericola chiayiensis]
MNDQQRPWGEESSDSTAADAVPPTQELGRTPAGDDEPATGTPAGTDPVVDTSAVDRDPSVPEPDTAPDGGARPGTDPAAGAAAVAPLVRTGPRASTIVWGLVVLVVGLGLLARTAGLGIDGQLTAIVLLAAAGALLVVASVVGAVRRRGRT